MKAFLDSSALVKRYIKETGTGIVIETCRDATEIAVSIICITEVLSACNRLARDKAISEEQYNWIKHEFLQDIDAAEVIMITGEVIENSILCLEKGVIRSLDALHIGAAMAYNGDIFLTGDSKQKYVAEKMGLKVLFC